MTNPKETYVMHISECTADLIGNEYILTSSRSFSPRIIDILFEELEEKVTVCTHIDDIRSALTKMVEASRDIIDLGLSCLEFDLIDEDYPPTDENSILSDFIFEFADYIGYNIPLIPIFDKTQLKKSLIKEFNLFLKSKPEDARYWVHAFPLQFVFDTANLKELWESQKKFQTISFEAFNLLLSSFVRTEYIRFETNTRIIL